MNYDGRVPNYFTNAVHKDCGGLVRVVLQVTDGEKRVGFMCAKCRSLWVAPAGTTFNVPPAWVEKEQK
jgi:hypothetical protein